MDELQASFLAKIKLQATEDERFVEFLTCLNLIIEAHYARLLSMKSETLQVWSNSWFNSIAFKEQDMIWKAVYTEMLNSVVSGKDFDIIQDVARCKELIEAKVGDDLEKLFEIGSITLAIARLTDDMITTSLVEFYRQS